MKIVPFMNKIIKQGNSLCIRVPNSVVKELSLKEGSEVAIEISKPSYNYNEKTIQGFLDIVNKVKEVDRFNDLQKRFFTILLFKFLEKTKGDPEKNKDETKEFWKTNEKEFGKKFIDDFNQFAKIVRDQVIIYEENGTYIVREEYRPNSY